MSNLPYKLIGVALAALAILATIGIGWSRYDAAQQRAIELEAKLKAANEELNHVQTVLDAVDENASTTREIDARTQTIEDEINALPKTQACVSTPAISHVITRLQSYQQQSTEDNLP